MRARHRITQRRQKGMILTRAVIRVEQIPVIEMLRSSVLIHEMRMAPRIHFCASQVVRDGLLRLRSYELLHVRDKCVGLLLADRVVE